MTVHLFTYYQHQYILFLYKNLAPPRRIGTGLRTKFLRTEVQSNLILRTNNLRDNWTIGYTSKYLTAVWVGNNDNTSMRYVASGVTGASPIWGQIMKYLLAKHPPNVFTPPVGMKKVQVCKSNWEFFVDNKPPQIPCPETPTISPTPNPIPPSIHTEINPSPLFQIDSIIRKPQKPRRNR